MITNFENLTQKLTQYEWVMAKVISSNLAKKTKDNPVKSKDIIIGMTTAGYRITDIKLRKIINLLRRDGVLPIMGTSKGYYVDYNKDEIKRQIKSSADRASAILEAAKGLEKWL